MRLRIFSGSKKRGRGFAVFLRKMINRRRAGWITWAPEAQNDVPHLPNKAAWWGGMRLPPTAFTARTASAAPRASAPLLRRNYTAHLHCSPRYTVYALSTCIRTRAVREHPHRQTFAPIPLPHHAFSSPCQHSAVHGKPSANIMS